MKDCSRDIMTFYFRGLKFDSIKLYNLPDSCNFVVEKEQLLPLFSFL